MDDRHYLVAPCPWPLRTALLAAKELGRKPGEFMATKEAHRLAVKRSVSKTTQRWAVKRMLKRVGL